MNDYEFEIGNPDAGGVGKLISIGGSGGSAKDAVDKWISMALNKAADRARTLAARQIAAEVNLAPSYINDKLKVTQRATKTNPEAHIKGSYRPTSLARYATSKDVERSRKSGGVSVQVQPGSAKFIKGAFLIPLKSGQGPDAGMGNIGLAIRLKPGSAVKNKKKYMAKLAGDLYLLYGPSVQQTFINNAGSGAGQDISQRALDILAEEFLRLSALEL